MTDISSIFRKFLSRHMKDGVRARGWADIEITRADGTIERRKVWNQELAAGLNELAQLAINSRAPFAYLVVGTQTATASLGSPFSDIGEVSRKAAATLTTSKMTMILVSTWGGAADSVTSVALESAGINTSASSGQGIGLNMLTGVAATLADSDLLKLQVNFQIGSHNL